MPLESNLDERSLDLLTSWTARARPASFMPDNTPVRPGEIAVGREKPMPVGTAPRDVSVFGCRDMAGNGREWTRTVATGDPDHEDAVVVFPLGIVTPLRLRGHSYLDTDPYLFEQREPDEKKSGDTGFDVGFRVVLEAAPAR